MNNDIIENSSPKETSDLFLQEPPVNEKEEIIKEEPIYETGIDFNKPNLEDKKEDNKVPVGNLITGNDIHEVEDIDNSDLVHEFTNEPVNEVSKNDEELDKLREDFIKKEKEKLLQKKLEEEAKRKAQIEKEEEEFLRAQLEKNNNKNKVLGFLGSLKDKIPEKKQSTKQETKTQPVPKSEPKEEEVRRKSMPIPKEEPNWKEVATTDSLTKLQNGYAYNMRIQSASLYSTVIFIDANNLKYLNDNFGHSAGNELLLTVAEKLKDLWGDDAFRIGGDEFVVVTEDKNYVKKIKEFHKYLDKKSGEYIFSASVGYHTGDGKTDLSIIKEQADKNMYREKEKYKKAHPELDMRNPKSKKKAPPKPKKKVKNVDDHSKRLLNISDFDEIKEEVPGTNAVALSMLIIVDFINMSKYIADQNKDLIENIIRMNKEEDDKAYYMGEGKYIIYSKNKDNSDILIGTLSNKCDELKIKIVYNTIMSNGSEPIKELSNLNYEILEKKAISAPKKPKKLTYDDKLSKTQRDMKQTVQNEHITCDPNELLDIIDKVQVDYDHEKIFAILMSDKDFNNLFVFMDVEHFLELFSDNYMDIDYSYLYAVYPGGAYPLGQDEYHNEITVLFNTLAEKILAMVPCKKEEIAKIPEINVFQNIHIDGMEEPEEKPENFRPSRRRRRYSEDF